MSQTKILFQNNISSVLPVPFSSSIRSPRWVSNSIDNFAQPVTVFSGVILLYFRKSFVTIIGFVSEVSGGTSGRLKKKGKQ